MTALRSLLLQTLTERGFLHQCTDLAGLDNLAESGVVTGYIGFDATADSLHIGSLLQIMLLRRLQQAGHRPIVLLGGGTTRVGDPSGKDESRRLLTEADIAHNITGLKRVFERYLEFGAGPTDAVMLDNAEWLAPLSYLPFLRDVGRHFTVNRMLAFDSVKRRLEREQPLSFLEFNYMILQAYDFVELSRRQACRLQLGGSDQWGNIVNGVELARRTDGIELFGFTSPLITTSSGAKMGKTASGAVWLNEEKLPEWEFWQYWRNTEDADVGRFLRLFTDLPLDEVRRLEALSGAESNEAKKILAGEVTALCRGKVAAEAAAETARQVFEQRGSGDALPSIDVDPASLESGVSVVELLVRTGLASSNGEARRLIKGGGARVNDRPVSDEAARVTSAAADPDGVIKLSAGRKRHALVRTG